MAAAEAVAGAEAINHRSHHLSEPEVFANEHLLSATQVS